MCKGFRWAEMEEGDEEYVRRRKQSQAESTEAKVLEMTTTTTSLNDGFCTGKKV